MLHGASLSTKRNGDATLKIAHGDLDMGGPKNFDKVKHEFRKLSSLVATENLPLISCGRHSS